MFLAEAFTRPAMMHELAKAGFTQSYTYFTWRVYKQEIIDYCVELVDAVGLHAAELLGQHPGHQPVPPAVREPGDVRAAGGAGRDAVADLGRVRRASSCTSTCRSRPGARSTWTRRSSSSGRATSTPRWPRAARWSRSSAR